MKLEDLVKVIGSPTGIVYVIKDIQGGYALLVNGDLWFWDNLECLRRVK